MNVGSHVDRDDSIVKKEFYTYTPYTNSLGESEEIRIVIRNCESCLLPSDSYLYMRLTVTTDKFNATTTNADKIRFVNNFPSFLFSDARYELNGIEVDRIKNVGITSTMKLSAASCQANTMGYYYFYKSFTEKTAEHDKDMVYDVMIPLSIWFGFCDDYRKVILNSRHELILNRAPSSINCVYGGKTDANATSVKISISKLEWKMPHITLADKIKSNMNNLVCNSKRLAIQHRSWDLYEYPELPQTDNHIWAVKTTSHLNKPRYVLVAFQHDKMGNRCANASKFDSLHISSVRLHMNSQVYPYHMNDLNIPEGLYAELYQAYANIQPSYYHTGEKNMFANDFGHFQDRLMFAFDTSRADETLTNCAVDIQLEIKVAKVLPTKTKAYCLIIYDNQFKYSSCDGLIERCV